MTFDKFKIGMVLWDVHKYTMGNTKLKSLACMKVIVTEIHPDRSISASWNGNHPRKFYESEWRQLRIKKPEFVRNLMGQMKIKPRERKS